MSNSIKITNSKRKLVIFFYFHIFRVSKRLDSWLRRMKYGNSFRKLLVKLTFFRKPKTPSRFNKISARDVVNPIFVLGGDTGTPNTHTRAFRHYMAGPLFKSQRRPKMVSACKANSSGTTAHIKCFTVL